VGAAHELSRIRKPGTGERKLEEDAEGRGRSRGGRAGIYSRREKQRGRAPSPIGGPLNPGGATPEPRLYN
jgi:hypothetical protein